MKTWIESYMIIKKILLFFILGLGLVSCTGRKKIAYMQNIESVAREALIKTSRATIQPDDQLLIFVTAQDMSVTAPFNQSMGVGVSQSRVAYSQPSNNLPMAGQSTLSGVSYTVYPEGYIDFPVLGRINTSGKTVEDLKEELVALLKKYIINPTVSIKYANYRVTVLGEVLRSGEYVIPDGKTTLLNVLGLAGDLTIYGRRDNVLIVREENGLITQAYVDLTNADFINSPYYYLKQNDVVYVTPNKVKENSSMFGAQTGIYISVASVIVTILALVIKK